MNVDCKLESVYISSTGKVGMGVIERYTVSIENGENEKQAFELVIDTDGASVYVKPNGEGLSARNIRSAVSFMLTYTGETSSVNVGEKVREEILNAIRDVRRDVQHELRILTCDLS
jgi:hypothetical protein